MHFEKIRQPHASLDLASRHKKARKIEFLLDLSNCRKSLRILEIGTGSGGIAHYFATHPELVCEVTGTDVVDNRQNFDGYEYIQTKGISLPFEDQNFDVVISNHVIEHVGDRVAQQKHLEEMRRVLKKDGQGYLAVPNRWMVTEPHYRVKFLSWLPPQWRTPYLRWVGKGEFYDCEPLEMLELESMLSAADFDYRNICIQAMLYIFEEEKKNILGTRALNMLPQRVLDVAKIFIPTLIYRLQRK